MKLSVAYGTSTENGTKTAAQTWGNYAAMKAARPKLCAYLESKGVSNAEALKCSRFECDMNEDALYNMRSLVDASDIMGVFNVTMPVPAQFQKFMFSGPAAYAGPGWVTGGICLKVDHTNWKPQWASKRNIFPVNDWGQPANAGGAYAEGFTIQDVQLDGGRSMIPYDPSFESYGIAIRNSGSACAVRNVVANGFNNSGFAWAGGIPIFAENTRSFYNGQYGYHLIGTGLSTGTLIACETDDCGKAMFGIEPGYGQAGGGNLTITSSKAENGKNGTRPMQLAYIRGAAGAIQFIGFHAALYNGTTVGSAFDIQGSGSNMTVTVSGFNECGSSGSFTKLLTTASKSYGMTNTGGNSCKPISFITDGTTMKACTSALSGTTQPDTITNILVVPVGDDTPCPECPDLPDCPPPPNELIGPWYKSGSCRYGKQTWRRDRSTLFGSRIIASQDRDSLDCSITTHP